MPVIDIRLHKGMFPNADPEDIKPEYANDLINFIPKDTRLVKAIGSGPYMGGEPFEPLGKAFTNMFDFISSKINMLTGTENIVGHMNLFNVITASTGLLGAYVLNDNDTFIPLSSLAQVTADQSVFLAYESGYRHPMIATDNVMRIICGKDDYIGAQLLTNAWIGWIDRKQYNEQRTIAPAFYIHKAPLPVALISGDFTWTLSSQVIDSDAVHENPTVYYYKYSMVYDYNQEGLLSDIIGTQELYDDEGAVLNLYLEELATYNRLTAIKLYRSINKFSNYELISLFNAVADSDELLSGTDGAFMAKIFFDSATLKAYNIRSDFHLRVTVDTGSGYRDILAGAATLRVVETGTGNKILTITDPVTYLNADWSDIFGGQKYPISSWNLTDVWNGGTLNISGDGSDLQFDLNVMCFNNANASSIKVGDLVKIGTDGYAEVNKIITDSDNNCSLGFTENLISNSYTQTSGFLTIGQKYTITAGTWTRITSGLLVIGTRYLIENYNGGGDDFTNVGASANETGISFIATGITPNNYAGGSTLTVGDDFTNVGASANVIGVEFIATGATAAEWTNGSTLTHTTVGLIAAGGTGYFSGKTFYIFTDGKTNAITAYSAGGVGIEFLDLRQSGTSPHPLAGEVSIQVNSKYGRYNSGRMWQINSILDPAGVAEEQVTLLMYSEYNQPDVMPVSNAIQLYDKMGGETLGIEILYDFVIVIKKHTLFMVNPIIENDPSTWTVSESPHGIGCVSDIGHVVANGSLYVIYYDGIYEFKPNNLAESDSTPLERLKITDPIEDIFLGMSDAQKEAMNIYHDKIRNEIIVYAMTYNSSYTGFCFNLFDRSWRRMNLGSEDPTLFLHNDESHLILFDSGSGGFLDINAESGNSAITPTYRTLDFTIGVDKYEILRHFAITYKSAETLAFKIYDAETDVELFSYTLPVKSSAAGTEKIGVRERARKMYIKITGASSTNAVEIHRLVLVPENSSE